MAVKPHELDHQERGLDLESRERSSHKRDDLVEELTALRARIAAVKATPPTDPSSHCRDCFLRGVRAAIEAIEGG